jgi:tetratricopeptide (TPR) repeat protein
MRSGLWILLAVLILGMIVGYVVKDRFRAPEPADQQAELQAVLEIADSETKIDELEDFISDYPEGELKARAYNYIARELLDAVNDTTRFIGFARQMLEREGDAESKATIYYRLYGIKTDSRPEEAALIGTELLKVPIDVDWIYNAIGYDLAERKRDFDLAFSLCTKAIEFSKTRRDSASSLDSRGFVNYQRAMYQEALTDFEAAAALLEEPHEEILGHLANAYLKTGAGDRAFETMRSVLLMGEYEEARAGVDSILAARGYPDKKKQEFERVLWSERLAAARPAIAFAMPTLNGDTYNFAPTDGEIVILNFMSPT